MNTRKIDPDIIRAIDSATIDDPDFHLSVANKMWRPAMVRAALPWVDVKEHTNTNDGLFIEMIQQTVDGKAMNEAYCVSWVQTIIAYIEFKLNIKSSLKSTEGVLDLWKSTPPSLKTTEYPLPGYIAIWQHGNSVAGHCGIVLKVEDSYFKCIEANSYGPDGVTQGIFVHDRLYSGDGNMRLLGFVSPF